MLLNVVIKIITTELALTNKRIIAKFGFIRRSTVELRLEKVESIGVDQSILGRILGYGTIVVKGTGGTATPIPSISKPLEFRRVVNNHLEDENN
ncbi:Bacterial membrane flanked domain [Serratia quinivorans]|nr:Bacterial membrane flanked domain [Serratia quinivorans]CAI1798903.1 Bacterial membrane flanked domain [Serratia quinivorans]